MGCPATAIALEKTSCLLVELTRRIPEVAGSRVETRFAHLFLKLADWQKEGTVKTGKEGFVLVDRPAVEKLATG